MLEISHVKKSFGKNHVLRDVSMKVNKGMSSSFWDHPVRGRPRSFAVWSFWKKRTAARWTLTGNHWT